MKKGLLYVFVILILGILFISGCSEKFDYSKYCPDSKTEVEKNDCVIKFAIEKKDLSFCNKIADSDAKNLCFAVINVDSGFCNLIKGRIYKNSCYKELGLTSLVVGDNRNNLSLDEQKMILLQSSKLNSS